MAAKILSIDDSKTIRMIVARALRHYDAIIVEASNGQEGLAMAAQEKPDLIVLDVTMPVMDGIAVLSRLREQADLKRIPVIMLTAESGRETVARIAKLGARDYLVKPFKEEQLMEKVGRILKLQKKAAPPAAA